MASNRGRGSDENKRPNKYMGRGSIPNAKVSDIIQINKDDDNPVVVAKIRPGFYEAYQEYLGNIPFKIKAFGGKAKFLLNSCVDGTRISVEGRLTGDVWLDAPVTYYDEDEKGYVEVLDGNDEVVTADKITPLIEVESISHAGVEDLTDEAFALLENGELYAKREYNDDDSGGRGGGGRSSGGGGRSGGGRSSGRSSGRGKSDDSGDDEKETKSSGRGGGRSSGGRSSSGGGRSSGRSSGGRSSGGRSSGGRSSGGRSSGGRSSKNVGDDV